MLSRVDVAHSSGSTSEFSPSIRDPRLGPYSTQCRGTGRAEGDTGYSGGQNRLYALTG